MSSIARWRWWWQSTSTWVVVYPWASWGLIVIVVIVIVVMVIATLLANWWWALHRGSAWSVLSGYPVRVDRYRWARRNHSLAFLLGHQSSMSFLWGRLPRFLVFRTVLRPCI
jgi:hypothetical protein